MDADRRWDEFWRLRGMLLAQTDIVARDPSKCDHMRTAVMEAGERCLCCCTIIRTPHVAADLKAFWGADVCRLEYLSELVASGRIKVD